MVKCCFQRCSNPARQDKEQCHDHRKKKLCTFAGCKNQVNKQDLCVRHGARDGKPCVYLGCNDTHTRAHGMCYQHLKLMQPVPYVSTLQSTQATSTSSRQDTQSTRAPSTRDIRLQSKSKRKRDRKHLLERYNSNEVANHLFDLINYFHNIDWQSVVIEANKSGESQASMIELIDLDFD